MKHSGFFFFLLSLTAVSCTEIYKPELDKSQKVLVIEGLITDEAKTQTISLSTAVPFDSLANLPESGAKVFITDDFGNRFDFEERQPGKYSSNYSASVGRKYTLTVESKNKVYQSSEQELLPKPGDFEIKNVSKTKEMYLYNGKLLSLSNIYGAQVIASSDVKQGSNSYFRFANSIFVEYNAIKETDRILRYRWKKYNPNEYFNINNSQFINSGEFQHDLGFFPIDTAFYGVIKEVFLLSGKTDPIPIITNNYLYSFTVTLKQYNLNKEIYDYYKSLNKQLQARQRFFDPVASQVIGNIKCISDANEKVFGLFEISSVSINTFKVDHNISDNTYKFQKISPIDFDDISESGETLYFPPTFWIN